jgi:protease-4
MSFFDYVKNIFILLLFLVFAPAIFESIRTQYSIFATNKTAVGLIRINGDILDSQQTIQRLHTLFKRNDVKAILLTIDSCGGAAGSGQAIAYEIIALKKKSAKPIITLTENSCTSGAYYIACATDAIIASGQSVIGSVGSYIPHLFQFEDLLHKYDVGCTLIKAGSYKASTDPFVRMSDEAKTQLQSVVDDSYRQFVEDVMHRRKLAPQSETTWADGKLFTGKQALELGLIDALGSLSQAIAYFNDKLLIEGDIEWIEHKQEQSFLRGLLGNGDTGGDCVLFSHTENRMSNLLRKIALAGSYLKIL